MLFAASTTTPLLSWLYPQSHTASPSTFFSPPRTSKTQRRRRRGMRRLVGEPVLRIGMDQGYGGSIAGTNDLDSSPPFTTIIITLNTSNSPFYNLSPILFR
jgi:hypothetical protein